MSGIDGLLRHALDVEQQGIALLLGAAGAGKTRLADFCRRLCNRLSPREEQGQGTAAAGLYLPVWLPCPGLTRADRSVSAVVCSQSVPRWRGESVVLLLDGLDEVQQQRQQEVVTILAELLKDLTRCGQGIAIVTCRSEEIARILGIDRFVLSCPSYEILSPDHDERRALFRRLAAARGAEDEDNQVALRVDQLLVRTTRRNSGLEGFDRPR